MVALFPRFKPQRQQKLDQVKLRGFGGGLNTVHEDSQLDPRFLVEGHNIVRSASGAARIRFGSKYRRNGSDVATGDRIVDLDYFNGRLVCVTNTGQIFTMNEANELALIWSSAIAAALPGTPAGWGSTFVTLDFVPFRDKLIIHNGVDKPVQVDSLFAVKYLQDDASGSNVNVPIGKYGCVVSNYHCVAGIPGMPTTIYISSKGTAGVFPGDAAPNDSISLDVGAYAPDRAVEILGIAGFRTNLIIFFESQSLVVTLGEYTDAEPPVHLPKFPDTLPKFGLIGHRTITILANDLQFMDLAGACSAKRNLFSGLYDSKHLSEYIEPTYRKAVNELEDDEKRIETHTNHDHNEHVTTLILPDGSGFLYSFNDELKYRGWSTYAGPDYQCSCTSELGRVFYGYGMKIFQKGNGVFTDEDYYADMMGDFDTVWTNDVPYVVGHRVYVTQTDKYYTCVTAHNSSPPPVTFLEESQVPVLWEEYTGFDIDWHFELPWIDGKDPMNLKQLKFGRIGTRGSGEFTLHIYVDELYRDEDGMPIFDPALSMNFIGQDAAGYGADAGPYGASRPSNDARLYKIPVKFKTIKFRLSGKTRQPLVISTLIFLFHKGKYKRT